MAPPTLSTLPSEVISLILHHLISSTLCPAPSPSQLRRRYRLLLPTCLISRSFLKVSRQLLWEEILFETPRQVGKFCKETDVDDEMVYYGETVPSRHSNKLKGAEKEEDDVEVITPIRRGGQGTGWGHSHSRHTRRMIVMPSCIPSSNPDGNKTLQKLLLRVPDLTSLVIQGHSITSITSSTPQAGSNNRKRMLLDPAILSWATNLKDLSIMNTTLVVPSRDRDRDREPRWDPYTYVWSFPHLTTLLLSDCYFLDSNLRGGLGSTTSFQLLINLISLPQLSTLSLQWSYDDHLYDFDLVTTQISSLHLSRGSYLRQNSAYEDSDDGVGDEIEEYPSLCPALTSLSMFTTGLKNLNVAVRRPMEEMDNSIGYDLIEDIEEVFSQIMNKESKMQRLSTLTFSFLPPSSTLEFETNYDVDNQNLELALTQYFTLYADRNPHSLNSDLLPRKILLPSSLTPASPEIEEQLVSSVLAEVLLTVGSELRYYHEPWPVQQEEEGEGEVADKVVRDWEEVLKRDERMDERLRKALERLEVYM